MSQARIVVIGAGLSLLLLSGCSLFPSLGSVRWVDSALRLGVYLEMTGFAPFSDEAEAGKVFAFDGSVETSGIFTIDDVPYCDFALSAEAEYLLILMFGQYLSSFSGSYSADGDGFNVLPECEYETDALFEWIIEFEVLEPVIMEIVASLHAVVVPGVAGDQLHYIEIRQQGGDPICCDPVDGSEVDEQYDEAIALAVGRYEFAVYANPYLLGDGGAASITSGWTYEVTFTDDD